MCLIISKKDKLKKDKVIVYKVLFKHNDNSSISYTSQYMLNLWDNARKNKVFTSTRIYKHPTRREMVAGVVHAGYHVYTSFFHALKEYNELYEGTYSTDFYPVLVEFTAYKKDFIASGTNNDTSPGMVFNKLTWNRVVRSYKK